MIPDVPPLTAFTAVLLKSLMLWPKLSEANSAVSSIEKSSTGAWGAFPLNQSSQNLDWSPIGLSNHLLLAF